MKKNLIAAAVAGVLAVPFAVQAGSHEGTKVTFKGDAEVNYYNHTIKNSDMLPLSALGMKDVKDDQWDSRVRMVVTGTDGKNAMAKARVRMQNGSHGSKDQSIDFDYAYLQMNVDDLFTIKAGDWKRDWGHKLYVYDNSAEGISIIKKLGDLSFGLHHVANTEDGNSLVNLIGMQKGHESASTDTDQNDDDKYTIIFSAEMAGMMGLRIDRITDDVTNKNSTNFDIYGGAPLGGGWGMGFEYAQRGETTAMKKNSGLLLAVMGKAGPADLTIFHVMSKDGYETDNNLFAFNFTGDENGPILTGLGAGKNGVTDKNSTGTGIIAGFEAMPTVTLQLGLGLVTAEKGTVGLAANNADDSKITIVHAKAIKELSKNTSINGQFGMFSGDFKATAFGMSASTSF
jgi:hypothetical protein